MNTHPIHHTTTVRVRYADTDKMGIVYNGVYLQYFEIGRTELLRAKGMPYIDLERSGVLLPVLEARLQYHSPARYDDLLDIESTYTPEHGATIVIEYLIRCNSVVIATGFTRHSFVDAENFKPMRPPKSFTTAMSNAKKE